MNFMIINTKRFAGNNFVIAVIRMSSFIPQIVNILVLLFIPQIVNILVLLFWNLRVLDKLRHCFLNLKEHLKLIKNHNHYCCWCECYYKWHFYHYFHIVHYRWINWIKWTYTHCIFPFPFGCKGSYRKNRIIPINLSPLGTQTHACNYSQL